MVFFVIYNPYALTCRRQLININSNSCYKSKSTMSLSDNNLKFFESSLNSLKKAIAIGVSGFLCYQLPINALTYPLNSNIYTNSIINLSPSDDFWYPPYLIGNWKTHLKFDKIEFVDDLSKTEFEKALESGIIPGFDKYSVFFTPEVGKEVSFFRKYVQLDSHPREDHSYNIRQMVSSFSPTTVIDSAPYSYQLSSNWFDIPANKWNIKYHDTSGKGEVSFVTSKREIIVNPGSVESMEFFKQVKYKLNLQIVNN